MLSISEKLVLKAIITKCGKKDSCLASDADILCHIPQRAGISEKRLADIINCLEYDGYIDVVISDRHGEMVYCITVSQKGKGIRRESVQSKRYFLYRIFLAAASAAITFLIGKLLYAVIN